MLDGAGVMASRAGEPDSARRLFEESSELHEEQGETHAAARDLSRLGMLDLFTGRRDEAIARMERAFAVISADEPDEDLALLAARLSRGYFFSGDIDRAAERAELALDIAEAHAYPAALVQALRTKVVLVASRGHTEEALALLKHALEIALDHDLADDASVCYFLLSDGSFRRDQYTDALGYLDEALALARKLGNRPEEWAVLAERTYPLYMLGRWDEAQATSDEFTQEQVDAGGVVLSLLQSSVEIHLQRGELDGAHRIFSMFSRLEESTDVQERSCYLCSRASLRRAEGRPQEALADGEATIETGRTLGLAAQAVKQGLVESLEAAFALGEAAKIEELLTSIETVPAGSRPPYLNAQARRFRARLAGDGTDYEAAAQQFRELRIPFWLAVTLLEHAEWLVGQGQPSRAEPLLAEATEIFERLEARPWLERTTRLASAGQPKAVTAGH
jgi:tetratricopeptide (TPR) repeat protein